MRLLRVLVIGGVLVAGLAQDAWAQCRIEGVVRDASGTPLAGVAVVMREPNRRTATDEQGAYSFDDVKPGTYVRLLVLRDSQPVAERVALVTLLVERVDIAIRPPLETVGRQGPPGTVPRRRATPEEVATSVTGSGKGWSGGVRGVVTSADGLALPGASVAVDGTDVFAITDTEGRYTLVGLRPEARVVLVASAPGFETAMSDVLVPRGAPGTASFVLDVAPVSEAVTVTADLPMLKAAGSASRVSLRPEQVIGLPSLGEKDIFRALQLLPGVSGSQEASSGLYVRGGTPDQNLVSYDGFTLYHVDHLFGYFSAFNMDAIDRVEFSKSAFDPADGGRLSSVLRLTGKARAAASPTGFANVSLLSAGGLLSAPLGSRGGILVAARRSYQSPLYNQILDLFNTGGAVGRGGRMPRFSGGVFESTPQSWFYDVNGKIDFALGSRDRISASVYDGRDDLDNSRDLPFGGFPRFRLGETGVELPEDAVMQITDVRDWRNRGYGAIWAHEWAPAATTTLSVGTSEYGAGRSRASILTSPSTGEDYSITAGRGGSRGQAESNSLRDVTVKLDTTVAIGNAHVLSFGGESTDLEIDYDAQTEVLGGPGPAGGPSSRLVGLLDRSGSGRLFAGYVRDTWSPTARLVLLPGVRITKYDVTEEVFVEPRFSMTYQASRRFQLKGGYGVHHQMASRIAREDLTLGDRDFWTLADGDGVPVSRSRQIVFGASFETPILLIDAEIYNKALDDLTMFAPRLTPGAVPEAGASYLQHGDGTARGLEVLVQQKYGVNTGWISYTLGRTRYTFPGLEAEAFVASHDQTHEIKVADSVRVGRWTMGGTWIFGSGRPYTPATDVESVELPSGFVADRVVFGAKNSDRLPAYHRLDLSTQGDFDVWGVRSTVGATVFNVYNRLNVWYREIQTFGGSGVANDVTYMGRAFNVFVKVGF